MKTLMLILISFCAIAQTATKKQSPLIYTISDGKIQKEVYYLSAPIDYEDLADSCDIHLLPNFAGDYVVKARIGEGQTTFKKKLHFYNVLITPIWFTTDRNYQEYQKKKYFFADCLISTTSLVGRNYQN